MKRNTSISENLTHKTKFIDPASGQVLREGTTPMATVGDFKANPTPVEEAPNEEIQEMKNDMAEIKELLKGLTK